MYDESQIRSLVEEALDHDLSPEEVCRDTPELIAQVRRRLRQVRSIDAQIEAIFPSTHDGLSIIRSAALVDEAPLPDLPGYQVESVLGYGGMGVVYKARHLKLNRYVAIKMLLAGHYAGPQERARFTREAEAIASLQHPRIVQIFDVGELHGRPYLAMEYVKGGTLAQKLAGMPQSAVETAALIRDLARAVQTAHESGVVHRDLKPANILLTPEGCPKITDFGLARRSKGEPDITIEGARLGTPSYMAPEQARGDAESTGPVSDIYALGAILYEMLTGRPPFRADTPAETQRQVIQEIPAAPSRLNARIPRDLETICLKCLQKEPQRRYTSANELADDLERYLHHEPIRARPISRPERCLRWIRRRPTEAALIVSVFIMLIFMVTAGMLAWNWVVRARAESDRWEDRLAYVKGLESEGRFNEARAILLRAPEVSSSDLQHQITDAQKDLNTVERLDSVRLTRGRFHPGGGFDYEESCKQYEDTFRSTGLGTIDEEPRVVAERLMSSPVRAAVVNALDDWSACALAEERAWILAVARLLDPDPWRDRVRDQSKWADLGHLADLATTVEVDRQPVNIMVAMGTRWRRLGGDPTAFLLRVQHQFPNDFWVNFELGLLLGNQGDPYRSIAFCRAAIAIRPDAAAPRFNLAGNLARIDQIDEAISEYEHVLEIDPKHSWAHNNLAIALLQRDRPAEALSHFRTAHELDTSISVQEGEESALLELGRGEEVRAAWRKQLDAGSDDHDLWNGYAELSLFLGDVSEYQWARNELLNRFGSAIEPHICERVGRACLLVPASQDVTERAAALIDRAMAADPSEVEPWAPGYFRVSKGLVEYRTGKFDEAIQTLSGDTSRILQPIPALVSAMALYKEGRVSEAQRELASAALEFDWRPIRTNIPESWIYHSLRREAQQLILPDLPKYLDGTEDPKTCDECLATLPECQYQQLTDRVAQLYKIILNDPTLTVDPLDSSLRYAAACYAALAGSGSGRDAAALNDSQRLQWRNQAREWLQTDLDLRRKELQDDETKHRDVVRHFMDEWLNDIDFAGIRDATSLRAMTKPERDKWLQFWNDVKSLRKQAS